MTTTTEQIQRPTDLLSPKEVCEYLGISRRSLTRYVDTGNVPQPIRFNARMLRWRRKDLDATLERIHRKRA